VCLQVHALEAAMRARFAALRDSYQQQLDSLHMQVIEIDARGAPRPPQLPLPLPPNQQPPQHACGNGHMHAVQECGHAGGWSDSGAGHCAGKVRLPVRTRSRLWLLRGA
jgi:hypothetical protein